MISLYAYNRLGRLDRWVVVWTERAAQIITARWETEDLTVERKARDNG